MSIATYDAQRSKNRKCTQIGILNERSKSCQCFDRSHHVAYALTNAEYEVTRGTGYVNVNKNRVRDATPSRPRRVDDHERVERTLADARMIPRGNPIRPFAENRGRTDIALQARASTHISTCTRTLTRHGTIPCTRRIVS